MSTNTTAHSLVQAVLMDAWPSTPACVDYGLATQAHYEALYYPIRRDEVTAEQLHTACLQGSDALTTLARSLPSNPHKTLAFTSPYDDE
jgi:hypothetical protein